MGASRSGRDRSASGSARRDVFRVDDFLNGGRSVFRFSDRCFRNRRGSFFDGGSVNGDRFRDFFDGGSVNGDRFRDFFNGGSVNGDRFRNFFNGGSVNGDRFRNFFNGGSVNGDRFRVVGFFSYRQNVFDDRFRDFFNVDRLVGGNDYGGNIRGVFRFSVEDFVFDIESAKYGLFNFRKRGEFVDFGFERVFNGGRAGDRRNGFNNFLSVSDRDAENERERQQNTKLFHGKISRIW